MRGTGTTRNHLWKYTFAGAIGALFIAAGVLSSGTFTGRAAATTLGVDADTTDGLNTATSLGSIQSCREVSPSATFSVDVYVTDVTQLQGYSLYLTYDPLKLDLIDYTPRMLTGFPSSALVNPGNLALGYGATLATSGSGVLVSVQFQAIASGFSQASIRTDASYRPSLSGPNGYIGNSDNDPFGYFDGPILPAQVAIGTSCSGAPTPSPTPVTTPSPSPAGSPLPPTLARVRLASPPGGQ